MRLELIKLCDRRDLADMIYMSADGALTKRRIRILSVGDASFKAFCYLRREKRTFTIGCVLSVRRVISKESWVI